MSGARKWFWGIFFLLAAVLVVASQVTGFTMVSFWSIIATVVLAAIFLRCIIRLNFGGALFPLALLYIIYQQPLQLFYIKPWLLILAAVLGGIGISLLFRRRPRPNPHHQYIEPGGCTRQGDDAPPAAATQDDADDNHPTASVRWGATTRYVHASSLESGRFSATMGSLEIYLDKAGLSPNGAELFVDATLAAVTLYVPRGWRVEPVVSVMLGEVENDASHARPDPGAPRVILTGNILLGAITVQYV